MINLLIITHGDFGAYLLEAAEMIVGVQQAGIALISVSPRISIEQLQKAIAGAVEKSKCDEGTIIFTDILGGTPTNVSVPLVQGIDNAVVISGVNLNMLIAALSYRSRLKLSELRRKIIDDGKKSICDVKELIKSHHPAVG